MRKLASNIVQRYQGNMIRKIALEMAPLEEKHKRQWEERDRELRKAEIESRLLLNSKIRDLYEKEYGPIGDKDTDARADLIADASKRATDAKQGPRGSFLALKQQTERDEAQKLIDEEKAANNMPFWKDYGLWMGGGAALGGLAGAGIGRWAGNHTLLGTLLGAGVGAQAGWLGRHLYKQYQAGTRRDKFKAILAR